MRQTLNVLVDRDNLLEVLILSVAKDWVVDNYAVYLVVVVRIDEGVLEEFTVDFAEVESKATTLRSALKSLGNHNKERKYCCELTSVLTFQYKSCLSTQHIHEQRDRSSKGNRRGAAFAQSCSSHPSLPPKDFWQCCWQGRPCNWACLRPWRGSLVGWDWDVELYQRRDGGVLWGKRVTVSHKPCKVFQVTQKLNSRAINSIQATAAFPVTFF
jgi:hypothetical protein